MAGTQRFVNLDAEKQARVEQAAAREFALHGFERANTNRIAREAGISVGALFKYFPTKRDLFLHVVHAGGQTIERHVRTIIESDLPTMAAIEHLLQLIVETSREHAELVRLYHEITATGNWSLTREIAGELEGFTSKHYTALIARGRERGEVRTDVAPEALAFLMDNVFMSLQFSLACDYFRNRASLYLSPDADMAADALHFLRGALQPQGDA